MLSRICRFNHLFKAAAFKTTPFAASSPTSQTFNNQYALTSKLGFAFSESNKPKPNSGKDSQALETEMNPTGENAEGKEKGTEEKQQDGDGVEPTKFGNTMLLVSALCLAMAYAYMEIQVVRANKKKKVEGGALAKVTAVGKAQIGGDWQLIGVDGKPFSSQELKGKYYLIYFGFTHCPDICPNSLTKLSKAVAKVKKSKEANFFDLKTIFVSVDPDRDTPEKISKFIKLFDPEMIGVTGKANQDQALRDCMRKFKIYASKLQFQDSEEIVKGRKSYTIDHTILTYLMSDTNEYITHLGANMGEHDLTNIILEKITEDKREKLKNLKL